MLSSFILYFFVIFLSFITRITDGRVSIATAPSPQQFPPIPALYVFGDSLVENGNNKHFNTLTKCNYNPYGIDFKQGHTGRFSNGKTLADIVSEHLGLPYSPPYLNKHPKDKWITGYNYASAASGILPESGQVLGGRLNTDQQIELFKKTIDKDLIKRFPKKEDLSNHLAKSVLLFNIGNNDYLNNYLNKAYTNYTDYTPEEFADVLINYLSEQLKKVYEYGARKIMFVEVSPIGCMPWANKKIDTSSNKTGICVEEDNDKVLVFNKKLVDLFANLSATLPESKFRLAKTFGLARDIILNPTNYGLSNCKDSCCISMLKGRLKCIRDLVPCKHRNKYCFWDAFHPTEVLTEIVVQKCFNDTTGTICKISDLLA